MALLLFMVACQVLCAIVFACGGAIYPWIAIVAFVTAVAYAWRYGGVRASALVVATIAASLIPGMVTTDISYDSIAYHKPIVEQLLAGWNPFYHPDRLPFADVGMSLFISHYCKGIEIIGACIASSTGTLEACRAVNILLPAATALAALGAAPIVDARLSGSRSYIVAFGIVTCPLILYQFMSFYNDIALYCEFTIMGCAIALIATRSATKTGWGMLIAASVLAASSKFNHLMDASAVWILFIAVMAVYHGCKSAVKSLCAGLILLSISVTFLNFNPYVINTRDHADPFYPLMTQLQSGEVDNVLDGNVPEAFEGNNRLVAFAKANLSVCDGEWSNIRPWGLIDHPTAAQLICSLKSYDSRALGFGPLFLPLLLAALLLLVSIRAPWWAWSWVALCAFLTFIFPVGWWARFAPFFWTVIPLSLAVAWIKPQSKMSSFLIVFIAAALIANFTIYAIVKVAF